MNYSIGIDIGGTKTAVGLVTSEGTVLLEETLKTDQSVPPAEMCLRIINTADQLTAETGLDLSFMEGLGIIAPGPLNSKTGRILCPPNLPGWENFDIVNVFTSRYEFPVKLQNDANAAAEAEKWLGGAKDLHNFIYLTISTGIGGGIFAEGNLLEGRTGNAAEVGHMVMDPAYGTCRCGQKGCFEWIASGTAIARRGSERFGKSLSSQEVVQLYMDGETAAVELMTDIFRNIGIGCVSLINLFDPEKIIIGGGVSNIGEPLFKEVRKYVKNNTLNPGSGEVEIEKSSLNFKSGVVAAASLIHRKKEKAAY
ncbi:ROK family protein [Alkalicoccus saliphilus]|uniref:Transcriptional regulator n=1 Tax=Alkalicoccus saliphilus TaxID=200989 RepID=A0A2T4U6T3_9BACI|nr:ROK family protein [Alkalicoccus saliphilus]PTL39106.1 transcriptional regulator [Alkalicoccus saliphilus]